MKPPCPPKSECWCIEHPNHKDCVVPALTFENKMYFTGLLLLMIFWIILLMKNKNNYEQQR